MNTKLNRLFATGLLIIFVQAASLVFIPSSFAQDGSADGVDQSVVLSEFQGIIDELNFGQSTIQISGYDYPVSQTVKVEIAGTYGAFTMLTKGMRVRFLYNEYDDGSRLITEIIQDPAAQEF